MIRGKREHSLVLGDPRLSNLDLLSTQLASLSLIKVSSRFEIEESRHGGGEFIVDLPAHHLGK